MSVATLENRLLQEKVYTETLESGLKVFVLPKPGFHKKYAVFATRYGSVDSVFAPPGRPEPLAVPDGIAHFLEHKLFEEEYGNVFDKFAELGASANAYTSYTLTSYLFSCTDRFPESFDLLLDFVQRPYFTEENVEKEKGIIEQELRMYEDHPDRCLYINLLEALYHKNPVRLDIGGTVESIRLITKDLLYTCYETFYHPDNMAVFAVGDFDPEAVLAQVRRDAAERGARPQGPIRRFYPEEPTSIREGRVEDELAISRPRYALGFKDPDAGLAGEALLRRELATNVVLRLCLGRSSTLFNSLYEQGLIDDHFSGRYSGAMQFGHTVIGGETSDPERLHAALVEGVERLCREGVRPGDFERVRRQYIGSFLDAFNSLEFIANSFLSNYFRDISLFDYVEAVDALTLDALNERLHDHFDFGRSAVSVLWPKGKRG